MDTSTSVVARILGKIPTLKGPWHREHRQAVALAFIVAGCAVTAGCAQNPWVKPYERDALNDPLLSMASELLVDRQREAAIAVRQGARGAVGLPGDGCGCD